MDPALHKALYPEHSYSDETYWADLRGRERLTWINKESVSVPPLGMPCFFYASSIGTRVVPVERCLSKQEWTFACLRCTLVLGGVQPLLPRSIASNVL